MDKQKRFYSDNEAVWVIAEKKTGKILTIDRENKEATVLVDNKEVTLKLWEIDKLKYRAKETLVKERDKRIKKRNPYKTTYFASVKGGIIPTKEDENAGRDCYARLEPVIYEGKEVYELHIPKLTLAKIPLGFASYLDKEDFLSLKHERSSVGSTGLINVSGLVDSTYQGEVILQVVPLISDIVISSEVEERYFDEELDTYFIPYHRAIAQAVVMRQSDAKDEHISYDELYKKPSTRGIQGWGSTGK